jgi:hypothetical protein
MDTSYGGKSFMYRAFWLERPPVELPLGGAPEQLQLILLVQLNVKVFAIGPGVKNPCESQVWYLIAMIRSHNVGEDFNIL